MLLAALLPVLLAMAIAYPASLYFGPPVGGISRRGAWPERDYIWQQEPQGIEVLENSDAIRNADVVVIGDSFSVPNAWQSVVSKETGLKFKTYNYFNNHDCFLPWIDRMVARLEGTAQGGNRMVVIETIEHQFMQRFKEPERCAADSLFQVRTIQQGVWNWSKSSVHTQIDLARQFQTLVHMWQVYYWPHKKAGEWVVNAPLKRADLFSNNKSERLLYIDLDEHRWRWTQADIDQAVSTLKKVQSKLEAAGFRFTMLIIPDKLHVYEDELLTPSPPHPAADLSASLRRGGVNSVDVLTPLKSGIYQARDLYMPNDDHLGPQGQRMLGRALVNAGVLSGMKQITAQ
jgi:hypothetical protein